MSHFIIQTPIWNGGKRCVGLCEHRLNGSLTTFEILYRNKEGNRIYPYQFRIKTEMVLKCPLQWVKGMPLRIVPLLICHEVTP